ncbi:glycosyltransferase family 2 protein [Patescibacteria group bacterium]
MKSKKEKVSVIVPIFNEAGVIKKILSEIKSRLKKSGFTYEIIVVNDGSTDTSGLILEKERGIRVISNSCNQGYGFSIKRGVGVAKFKIIAIIDCDGSYQVKDLLRLIKAYKPWQMVIGARVKSRGELSLSRRIIKNILNSYVSYLTGKDVLDLNSGLRVFSKKQFLEFLPLFPKGFSLTSTLTLSFYHHGYLVRYLPIDYLPRVGSSKMRLLRDPLKIFFTVFKISFYYWPLKAIFPFVLVWGLSLIGFLI